MKLIRRAGEKWSQEQEFVTAITGAFFTFIFHVSECSHFCAKVCLHASACRNNEKKKGKGNMIIYTCNIT